MSLVGKSIGRYRITEQLGQGGMAVVFKAYDTRLERDVAIKMIRKGDIPENQHARFLQRFEREAKAQARFSHANIVKVLDYGEHEGSPYLILEYYSGGNLKQLLQQLMDYQVAARLLLPVADALAYAHEKDVLHRDVKPANIILTEKGEPILADFGIAKLMENKETALTATGLGIGTPEYMAPEQWIGEPVPQSDIYGLGVIFYELITGRKPYTTDTPGAVAIMQVTEPLPLPSEFVHDLPEMVEKVLLKALAVNPEDRYQQMSEFADALKRIAETEKVLQSEKQEEVKAQVIQPPTRSKSEPVLETSDSLVDDHEITEQKSQPAVHSKPEFMLETHDALAGDPEKQSSERSDAFRLWLTRIPLWGWVVGGIVILGLLVIGMIGSGENTLADLFATNTPTITPTHTSTSTQTNTPTPSYTPTPTATPLPDHITNAYGHDMVLIPAGIFEMGSADGRDERPVHEVYLDTYYIDLYEVTNAKYARCVDAGICDKPGGNDYSDPEYAEHPVVYVDWTNAQSYCTWIGGSLPTEAQWEKAARGTDGRKYPWGEGIDSSLANYESNVGDTTSVGSYPDGISPYGLYDMAGNVWEWVADWYSKEYYTSAPYENPVGPASGDSRVLRGGSWNFNDNFLRAANRNNINPDNTNNNFGFRCAASP